MKNLIPICINRSPKIISGRANQMVTIGQYCIDTQGRLSYTPSVKSNALANK